MHYSATTHRATSKILCPTKSVSKYPRSSPLICTGYFFSTFLTLPCSSVCLVLLQRVVCPTEIASRVRMAAREPFSRCSIRVPFFCVCAPSLPYSDRPSLRPSVRSSASGPPFLRSSVASFGRFSPLSRSDGPENLGVFPLSSFLSSLILLRPFLSTFPLVPHPVRPSLLPFSSPSYSVPPSVRSSAGSFLASFPSLHLHRASSPPPPLTLTNILAGSPAFESIRALARSVGLRPPQHFSLGRGRLQG